MPKARCWLQGCNEIPARPTTRARHTAVLLARTTKEINDHSSKNQKSLPFGKHRGTPLQRCAARSCSKAAYPCVFSLADTCGPVRGAPHTPSQPQAKFATTTQFNHIGKLANPATSAAHSRACTDCRARERPLAALPQAALHPALRPAPTCGHQPGKTCRIRKHPPTHCSQPSMRAAALPSL